MVDTHTENNGCRWTVDVYQKSMLYQLGSKNVLFTFKYIYGLDLLCCKSFLFTLTSVSNTCFVQIGIKF